MASGLRTRMLGAGTLVNVWEVMTVKSTQRYAVTVASLMGLMLAAAPLLAQPAQQPAQRGGPPNPDTPQILVAVLQSSDRALGVQAADEIRRRIQQEHSAKELYVISKKQINSTLDASGYRADSALLCRAGVRLNEREAPVHDPETFETNVPGLFVAGGAIAGVDTGTIFIENGRFHGEKIVEAIARRG